MLIKNKGGRKEETKPHVIRNLIFVEDRARLFFFFFNDVDSLRATTKHNVALTREQYETFADYDSRGHSMKNYVTCIRRYVKSILDSYTLHRYCW